MTLMVDLLLDAQSCNQVQDRELYDPSPEIDSAIERAAFLLKTANDVQRPYAAALMRQLVSVRESNRAERGHEMAAAGLADPVTNVHVFAKVARPLLADIMHPFVGDAKRAARLGELHRLFARTRYSTRTAFSLRPLLGVKKFTALEELHEAWDEARDRGCAA
jgi:hypothetical protein